MSLSHTETRVRALDGLSLRATLVTPDDQTPRRAVVLVHGGGVTREEGGFFTRLARHLGESGVASLRFDLRGHGNSQGAQDESTLAEHLNDIRAAIEHLQEHTQVDRVGLLGASFGGGLCAYFAARGPLELHRLVLLNPLLDFKGRFVDQKPHWINDRLTDEAAATLCTDGFISHSPTVSHGRAMLNEVFWISPRVVLDQISAPTLLVHGTKDTFIPVESSRAATESITVENKLVEIDGAQHGFAVHEDPGYTNPQSQNWQAFVIDTVGNWFTK